MEPAVLGTIDHLDLFQIEVRHEPVEVPSRH